MSVVYKLYNRKLCNYSSHGSKIFNKPHGTFGEMDRKAERWIILWIRFDSVNVYQYKANGIVQL